MLPIPVWSQSHSAESIIFSSRKWPFLHNVSIREDAIRNLVWKSGQLSLKPRPPPASVCRLSSMTCRRYVSASEPSCPAAPGTGSLVSSMTVPAAVCPAEGSSEPEVMHSMSIPAGVSSILIPSMMYSEYRADEFSFIKFNYTP